MAELWHRKMHGHSYDNNNNNNNNTVIPLYNTMVGVHDIKARYK